MPPELPTSVERQLELERRANGLRAVMLADPTLGTDVQASEAAIAAGDWLSLDDFEAALKAQDRE
jgi:hypothetical protein